MAKHIVLDKRYSLEEVHKLFESWNEKYGPDMNLRRKKRYSETFDGFLVKTWSQRYELFLLNHTCVQCGLEATYYKLEKQENARYYHFNLYGTKNGREVLFTKDHIIPASKGGPNHVTNYQTMCCDCNYKKGDKFPC